MGRWLIVVALLCVLPSALAQPPDPSIVGDYLGDYLEPVVDAAVPVAETVTGEDLVTEDIRISVLLDARNVEFQLVSMLIGGGKVQADITADLHLEFRAVSTERLDQALEASGDGRMSLNRTFGVPTNRTAITAEEIRLIGGGALLEAFQKVEVDAARSFLQETVPEMTVLGLDVAWSNTAPLQWFPETAVPGVPPRIPTLPATPDPEEATLADPVPPLREPPIILDASARVQYLDRMSVAAIVAGLLEGGDEGNASTEPEDPAKALKEELIATQFDPFMDRSAFEVLAFSQLLSLNVPPGWSLDVTLLVPKGFTVEGTTDELQVIQTDAGAAYFLDGSGRSDPSAQAGLVTISSRGPVTLTALVLVGVLGIALRLLIEVAVFAGVRLFQSRATE